MILAKDLPTGAAFVLTETGHTYVVVDEPLGFSVPDPHVVVRSMSDNKLTWIRANRQFASSHKEYELCINPRTLAGWVMKTGDNEGVDERIKFGLTPLVEWDS